MQVSLNEVYRVSQRALEGAGAAYGIDRDGAEAVAWLEGRGLPGLSMLAAALDRLDGVLAPLPPPQQRSRDEPPTLDLGGRPSIVWTGALMDCLRLQRGQGGRGSLRLRDCRWPLFLLPEAARAAERGRAVHIGWNVDAARVVCAADPAGGCRIVIEAAPGARDGIFLDQAPAEVVIEESPGAVRVADRRPATLLIDAAALDEILRRNLAEGVRINAPLWDRVSAAAKRVLVPATEESRVRGAGGGDANA